MTCLPREKRTLRFHCRARWEWLLPSDLMTRSTEWTYQPPRAEGTEHLRGRSLGRESLHTAAASKLIQQMDENVDSFQKGGIFVSSSSQKLRVNLLVGFEDYIFFSITAAFKQKEGKCTAVPTNNSRRNPNSKQQQPFTLHREAGALFTFSPYSPSCIRCLEACLWTFT